MATAVLASHYQDIFDRECPNMSQAPYSYTESLLQQAAERCELILLSDHCEMWTRHIQEAA